MKVHSHTPIGTSLFVTALFLAACDSTLSNTDLFPDTFDEAHLVSRATIVDPHSQVRKQLDATRIPGSIDDIFISLSDNFTGFGGAYLDENNHLVFVFKTARICRCSSKRGCF